MWSLRLFCAAFKLLRIVFRGMGFLKLRFDRAKQRYEVEHPRWCVEFVPLLFFVLLISAHFLLLVDMLDIYQEMKEKQPDLMPPFDITDLSFDLCHDVIYVLFLFYCLARRSQLWRVINQAQLSYSQIRCLLKKRFVFRCGKLIKLMGISQLLLLLLLCLKLAWFDWPRFDLFLVIDYILGAVRLLFVLLLTLQFFYHLLHAALLQSLNLTLKQQRNLKLLQRTLNVLPALQRMQHFAACYFGILFCCFAALLHLRCGMFVGIFHYDEQRFVLNEDNLEEEISRPPTRDELLKVDSLQLAWQMALMWLLLGAALLQQREQRKLMKGIW
ncbi:hypothetical protein KR044_013206, partial [Drosophila immigrans]